jgi:hypothetical protein
MRTHKASLLHQIYAAGNPVTILDVSEDDRVKPIFPAHSWSVYMPMKAERSVFGVLQVNGTDNEHLIRWDFLLALASQVEIAAREVGLDFVGV